MMPAALLGSLLAVGLFRQALPLPQDLPPDQDVPRQPVTRQCLACICEAVGCDFTRGCRQDTCGGYRMTEHFFLDSNVTKRAVVYKDYSYQSCASDRACASVAVKLYVEKFSRDCDQDGIISCSDYLLVHLSGWEGCQLQAQYISFTDAGAAFEACRVKLGIVPDKR